MTVQQEIADMLAKSASDSYWRAIFGLWLAGLVTPLLALVIAIRPYWPHGSIVTALIGALAVPALSTIIFGFMLSLRRLWKKSLSSVAWGTSAVMLCYAIAMVVLNPNDPTADNAAAVGIGIFILPTAGVLAILLLVGEGIGIAFTKLRGKLKEN